MPNISSLLKEEFVRLARKEIRHETSGLKKASAQYRSEIAALKRRVSALEKQLVKAAKQTTRAIPETVEETNARVRFSAKGLAKHRQRLGLSAGEAGILMGVSAQSVYNWETGKTRPREGQMAAIATLRSLGKREASAQLAELPK